MDFVSNDGRPLTTLADWRDHAGPVSPRAWAEGRSARELAQAWLEGDAPDRVSGLVASMPTLAGVVLERGIAEKETRFDEIRGGPRHHDLLVIGTSPAGPIVVGVEGKADESFDERLDAWVARARARNERSRAPERLDRLTTTFFGSTLDAEPLLATLRYQLLAGLAGTLADAREQAARQAILLVHEFETDWTDDELHRRNREDLDAFVGRLLPGGERLGDEASWIAGPRSMAGDGTWYPAAVDVYVAKFVTSTRRR